MATTEGTVLQWQRVGGDGGSTAGSGRTTGTAAGPGALPLLTGSHSDPIRCAACHIGHLYCSAVDPLVVKG